MTAIAENLDRLREEVATACRSAGRRAEDVALMAVSKVHPVECMIEAYEAGQRLFGENRVQEFESKAARVRGLAGLEVHLIGPLQSNKSAKAAQFFDAVDTIDSLKTAQRVGAAAVAAGRGGADSGGGEAVAGGDEAWGRPGRAAGADLSLGGCRRHRGAGIDDDSAVV